MTLQFCPVCKKLLKIRNENNKIIGFCECGFKRLTGIDVTSVESNIPNFITQSNNSEVSVKNENGYNHICSKCGFGEADIVDMGERSTDENHITLLKCKKCGNCDRE